MSLTYLLILPLITLVLVALAGNEKQVKGVAFLGTALQVVLAGYFVFAYQHQMNGAANPAFIMEEKYVWFNAMHIEYHIGIDGISMAMIALTAIVALAGVLVSWTITDKVKEFFALLLLLTVGAYGFFISLNLFTLFFFLELAVIPKYLLIVLWGSGNKIYSANKLALLLMLGSALLFVGIIGLYIQTGNSSLNIITLSAMQLSEAAQIQLFPFLFIGFGIFTALFPFHIWVPDGHSSAPTAASMFLAGISMKLGGYGCLRVATYLLPAAAQHYSLIIIILATIAIVYGAFATMMQTDLKYINAYSSVSHCGFVLLGIGMLTQTAIAGAVIQMVSHGLMTALFFAAIGMLYQRTHTRQLAQLGGLLKVIPFISTVFVIAGLCSLGLPGFSGFVAEMTVFVGAWQNPDKWYRMATILSASSIVITAVYILRAAGKTVMGKLGNDEWQELHDAKWYEKTASVVLLSGILLIGMAPFLLNKLIMPATIHIIQKINEHGIIL